VAGTRRPIATYRAVDLYETLGAENQPIRENLPHFKLDADVSLMTPDEQREAIAVLLESVDRLSNLGTKA
jgi:hypothetical protein